MDILADLQRWYHSYCDGAWEHENQVKIFTVDNPGWGVMIDLAGTDLSDRPFEPVQRDGSEEDWCHCFVRDNKFHGAGGALNLDELLRTFVEWMMRRPVEGD